MKQFLLSVLSALGCLSLVAAPGQVQPVVTTGVSSPGLSSNQVYNIVVAYGGTNSGQTAAQVSNSITANAILKQTGFGDATTLTNPTVRGDFKVQGTATNSLVETTNGAVWLQSSMWGAIGNAWGGGLNWMQQGNSNPSGYESSGTPMGIIRVFDNWGGQASSAFSPWMLITSPNIRLEEGSAGATVGVVMLGNEDSSGEVQINFNRGTLNQESTTANYIGFSHPLGFIAAGTGATTNEYLVKPGIISVAVDPAAPTDSSGYRQGELWFQSLVPSGVNGGYAQNGANSFYSNTIAKMHTNYWEMVSPLVVSSLTNSGGIASQYATHDSGKKVIGTLNGSGWTNLNASELRSGVVAPQRLSDTNSVSDGYSLTFDHGTNKWASVSGGSGAFTGNPNQFTVSNGKTNIVLGALVTNMLNEVTGDVNFVQDDGGLYYQKWNDALNRWETYGYLAVVSTDAGMTISTNLNPANDALIVNGDSTFNGRIKSSTTGNTNAYAYWGPNGNLTNNTVSGGGTTNMMVTTLTYGTTVTPSFSVAGLSTTALSCRRVTFRCTLTGNITTVAAPTGTLIDGDEMIWEMIQDGTGSRTITGFDSVYAFGADITGITLTTTASKRDFLTWKYNSTSAKWYALGFVRGY